MPWLRVPIPENSELEINDFADLLASFLKYRIDALASNLVILLPPCTFFKVIKINVGAEVVEILIDVTVSARISSIRSGVKDLLRKTLGKSKSKSKRSTKEKK